MAPRAGGAAARSRTVADAIDAAISPVFEVLQELSDELVRTGDGFSLDSLGGVRAIAQRTVTGNAGWIAGTGYVAAVDALSDMSRWVEWWMAAPGAPRPLRVTLDPRLPDFYDYTNAEWFRVPQEHGSTTVDGPYVDVRGTNEYTVTVSMPVNRGGAFVGVAAADLYLSGLERRLLPILSGVPDAIVLSNADGRVIASTDWRYLPGHLLDQSETRTPAVCRSVPWRVGTTKPPSRAA